MQQNFWVDPPVVRGVNVRAHHRQQASQAGCGAGSSAAVTDPLPRFTVNTERRSRINAVFVAADIDAPKNLSMASAVFSILISYKLKASAAIFNHRSHNLLTQSDHHVSVHGLSPSEISRRGQALVDHPVSGHIRQTNLGADQSGPHRSDDRIGFVRRTDNGTWNHVDTTMAHPGYAKTRERAGQLLCRRYERMVREGVI